MIGVWIQGVCLENSNSQFQDVFRYELHDSLSFLTEMSQMEYNWYIL